LLHVALTQFQEGQLQALRPPEGWNDRIEELQNVGRGIVWEEDFNFRLDDLPPPIWLLDCDLSQKPDGGGCHDENG